VPNVKIFGLELNPGRFTVKERVLVTIMAAVGAASAYAVSFDFLQLPSVSDLDLESLCNGFSTTSSPTLVTSGYVYLVDWFLYWWYFSPFPGCSSFHEYVSPFPVSSGSDRPFQFDLPIS
jgi:hypothetical protein